MLTAICSVRARECLDTPHKIKRCVSASITTCFLFPFFLEIGVLPFFFFPPHHQPFYIHFLIRIKVLEEEHRFVWDADDINTPGGMTDEQRFACVESYRSYRCRCQVVLEFNLCLGPSVASVHQYNSTEPTAPHTYLAFGLSMWN